MGTTSPPSASASVRELCLVRASDLLTYPFQWCLPFWRPGFVHDQSAPRLMIHVAWVGARRRHYYLFCMLKRSHKVMSVGDAQSSIPMCPSPWGRSGRQAGTPDVRGPLCHRVTAGCNECFPSCTFQWIGISRTVNSLSFRV